MVIQASNGKEPKVPAEKAAVGSKGIKVNIRSHVSDLIKFVLSLTSGLL
jgi:hypothetical protein